MSRNRHFRMGAALGTAYAPDSQGSSESSRVQQLGTSEYDSATSDAEGSAEGSRVAQLGGALAGEMVSNGRQGGMRSRMRGLREEDANVELAGRAAYYLNAEAGRADQMGDIRRDYYDSSLHGLREEDASVSLQGLREEDASIALGGLREEDAGIALAGLREEDASVALSGLRDGIILRGLREEDAAIALGQKMRQTFNPIGYRHGFRKGYNPGGFKNKGFGRNAVKAGGYQIDPQSFQGISGAEKRGPQLSEQGFHQRFPVNVRIAGIFDFLIPNMSWDEARSRLQTIIQKEFLLKQRIDRLPADKKAAVMMQNNGLKNNELFDGQLTVYLNEGPAGWTAHEGRDARLKASETAYPTIETLVAQMEQGLPPGSANAAAQADVANRIAVAQGFNLPGWFTPVAAAVGTVLIGAGAYAVAKAV